MSYFDFNSKKVLVTGGSRGIGKATAEIFMEHGAEVAITYNKSSEKMIEDMSSDYKRRGFNFIAYQLDLSDLTEVAPKIKAILKDVGHFDVLVNNAGIARDNYFMMMKKADISDVISVNLVSMLYLTQAVLPSMFKNASGNIINMSSLVAQYGNVGQANYAASKAGIVAFTKSLSLEVAQRNIRVNAISPGYIKTDMLASVKKEVYENITMKRLGLPNEIANVALFLASDMAGYITGQNIIVDGGGSLNKC